MRWAANPDPPRAPSSPTWPCGTVPERRNASWITVAETGNSVRNPPRAGRIEIDACGRCHGRATRLIGDTVHGRPLLDSHRPALLDPDQYWPDGQMRGEVFTWGPFLQSRMYHAGVTCSDCHQPHSLELRAQCAVRAMPPTRALRPDHPHRTCAGQRRQPVRGLPYAGDHLHAGG